MSDVQTPAGWYPDPEDPAQLRYWDGTAWTDHRHPAEPVAPVVPTEAPAVPAETPQFAYTPVPTAPPYGAAPAYGAAGGVAPAQNVPALVGLILAIVGTVLGLLLGVFVILGIAGGIVSIVGMIQATKMRAAGIVGDRRNLALAGIIVGFGGLLLNLLIGGLVAVYYATMYSSF
jgi:hypothetical protein